MEGERWKTLQLLKRDAPYSYFVLLTAWNYKQSTEYANAPEMPLSDFLEGTGGAVIHGEGGYNRYHVGPQGEIRMLFESAREVTQNNAIAVGFRIC